jgi:hypothetical protein
MALRQVASEMPAPRPLDTRAVVAGLVRSLARFRTWPFAQLRSVPKRVLRSFQLSHDSFTQVVVSGAFLGKLAVTNSAPHPTVRIS